MKKCRILVVLLCMVLLAGCGAGKSKEDPQKNDRRTAYTEALRNAMNNAIGPDGEELDPEIGWDEHTFFICDVDEDGKEELGLMWTGASSMASMIGGIYEYDCDKGKFVDEVILWPSIRVYEGGLIEADASHNHSLGESVWPYTVYVYDSEKDIYDAKYYVSAWDKDSDLAYTTDDPFPDDSDEDGDGTVYIIENIFESTTDTLDNDEFDKWVEDTKGKNEEVNIDYYVLNEENISKFDIDESEADEDTDEDKNESDEPGDPIEGYTQKLNEILSHEDHTEYKGFFMIMDDDGDSVPEVINYGSVTTGTMKVLVNNNGKIYEAETYLDGSVDFHRGIYYIHLSEDRDYLAIESFSGWEDPNYLELYKFNGDGYEAIGEPIEIGEFGEALGLLGDEYMTLNKDETLTEVWTEESINEHLGQYGIKIKF